jgi:hypothetical protein
MPTKHQTARAKIEELAAEHAESAIYLFDIPDKNGERSRTFTPEPGKVTFIPEMAEFTIEWPPGWILAHNHVRPEGFPNAYVGQDGFRAWFARPDTSSNYVRCRCGWAPHLGTHYRVCGS